MSKKIKLEMDAKELNVKPTPRQISEIRALAKLQAAESSALKFAQILGNDGKDVPKPVPQEAEINLIAEGLEIIEE